MSVKGAEKDQCIKPTQFLEPFSVNNNNPRHILDRLTNVNGTKFNHLVNKRPKRMHGTYKNKKDRARDQNYLLAETAVKIAAAASMTATGDDIGRWLLGHSVGRWLLGQSVGDAIQNRCHDWKSNAIIKEKKSDYY